MTDRLCMSTETLTEAVEQAIMGGCTMVQLREKDISSSDFYDLAAEIKRSTGIDVVQAACALKVSLAKISLLTHKKYMELA